MAEVEKIETTLDLSKQGLKKLTKVQPQETAGVTTLILDYNELQRWDNIDCYSSLKKLSASHNQLLRMYGVSRLHHLCSLNLSYNSILTIEGLKELVHLKWLCLASNNIKTIEHLHTNVHLEHLDLSENSITHIADVSFLKNLKQLLLHGNRISQLRQCDRHLPPGLTILTLAHNNMGDLNDMSHLAHLTNLREFSIAGNPCVNMTGSSIGFDYRPFVINWCMSLKVIDGYVVDAIESLKAEWLYSQGRGRQFRAGEQQALAQYLAGVCPMSGDTLQTEEERKLRLILSKAQQHQQALRDQVTTNGTGRPRSQILNRSQSSPAPSPAARRRVGSFRSSTGRTAGKNTSRDSKFPLPEQAKSPDRMVTSCQGVAAVVGDPDPPDVPQLMSQSLDPSLLFSTGNLSKDSSSSEQNSVQANQSQEDSSSSEINSGGNCPLQAASKLVPVPESLMSPDYRPVNPVVNRVMRPRSGTVGHTNGHHSAPVSTRQTGSVHSSPKMCRSLHASPRQRARSAIEPRGVHSLQQHSSHGHGHGHRHGTRKLFGHEPTSSDEDSEMSASKLETIRHRAQERWQRKEGAAPAPTNATPAVAAENAAVVIQRMWRGYHTRNLNTEVQAIFRKIQDSRTQQYIEKLSNDMEATRAALESDRKLQVLKMQAINAIWKKVLSMQPGGKEDSSGAGSSSQKSDTEAIRELTQTCSMLHSQVEQLQGSMQSMLQCMSVLCQMPGIATASSSAACPPTLQPSGGAVVPVTVEPRATATQTDIIAVITPQEETIPFPYQRGGSTRTRPSSLPIPQHRAPHSRPNPEAPNEVQQFGN
ncbi:hypothetical protein R5R35_008800 [Gryllus longicercus]|uniref:Centrosomal protein of 97 kDa n=1 Tax=Gryllus longicercus TaxID=2509291 RepID=A0AAN9VXS2_9ORTH